jgi:tRNA pseudouridine13 synthase
MRYLTTDLPGTGGRIKERPEDFRVTEVPLYHPSGAGDHVYLLVEKTGLGSLEAADAVARALGRPRHVVGMAGLKDAQSVARQWMSLEHVDIDKAMHLDLPGVRVLAVSRHRNKLKVGHLAGNRFEVRIRGCRPGARGAAARVLEVLQARGVPNWFDYQRFGRRADNHLLGRDLVLGDYRGFCDRFLGRPVASDSRRLAEGRRAYDAGDLEGARRLMTGQTDRLRVL